MVVIPEKEEEIYIEIIPEPKKKVTRTDIFRMAKAALIVFIGDEEKTANKTRQALIKIAYERL